jgi:hypothetical protein
MSAFGRRQAAGLPTKTPHQIFPNTLVGHAWQPFLRVRKTELGLS